MPNYHAWTVSPQEAVRIQKTLVTQIRLTPLPSTLRLVAGADLSYDKGSEQFYAGVVVVQLPQLQLVERASAIGRTSFPYIPGLLSFREAPLILEAFNKLSCLPEVLICDGQGIAHPRGFGIACHLGLFLDCATIGCAKSRLTGYYDADALPKTAGASVPLSTKAGDIIGAVVRTKYNIKPLFISPGHKADIASAVEYVLRCCQGYKLPEPTRLAHLFVNQIRKEHGINNVT